MNDITNTVIYTCLSYILKYSIKQRAEKIGMVMQNPNQMISKSMIYDEVALGLYARGIKEDEIKQRVDNTLKICGLYPFPSIVISDGIMIADTRAAEVLTDTEIIDKANLKVTSLYELAVRCDIKEPTSFVERFIEYDREVRGQ